MVDNKLGNFWKRCNDGVFDRTWPWIFVIGKFLIGDSPYGNPPDAVLTLIIDYWRRQLGLKKEIMIVFELSWLGI
jgi:hypothetical protein